MTKLTSKQYTGIAVFGAPGSGKTTIAKLLLQAFPDAKHIEAFDTVINPAFFIKAKLPKDEPKFIQVIARMGGKKVKTSITRDEARNFFSYLKNRYSSSVIAKTLVEIHQKKFPKKFIIIA